MNRNQAAGTRIARGFAVVVLALLAVVPAAAQVGYKVDPQGKDELWDVTSKMDMPGMPMAMPARTNRVCVEKGNDAATIPKNDGCTVVDTKRVGNKFTYRMQCKNAKNDYTATGESTSGPNGYQGKMHMAGKMEGEQMEMSLDYSGTRVGNCTSTAKQDIAAAKAQGEKGVADACNGGIERLMWQMFEPKELCAAKRDAFCAAVAKAGVSMQDPAQYSAMTGRNPDVRTSFAKCGQDFAATTRGACTRAAGAGNWNFVGSGHCDDIVRAEGPVRCAGRGGSPEPALYPLCSRYVTITRGSAAASGPQSGTPPANPAAPAAPPAQDPVQQGIDKMKKLLPF
jgi:hypothetical protein